MSESIIQTTLFSTGVRASQPFQTLRLSPNDWIIRPISEITCVFFYDIRQWSFFGQQANDMFINTERLISSLRKLLEYYPFLDGTFEFFDEDKKVSIEHDDNQGGILFVSTTVDITLAQLPLTNKEYVNTTIIPDTLQLTNRTVPGALFHVRHTRFACGSVALGISLNHQVADAHSYFQLIKDWTQLYKDLSYQPDVCHQRSLLEPSVSQIDVLKQSNANFDHRRSLSSQDERPYSLTKQQNILKTFHFSIGELQQMKSDAVTHLPAHVPYVSTFEVLAAHLYRHVMRIRQPTTSQTSRLYISTNIRPRLLQPSIPSTYFGNAIMFSYLEMNLTDLMNTSDLGLVAGQVHQAIEKTNDEDIRTTLAWITCQDDKTKIKPTFNLDQTDFTITAWNKMGMYSNSHFEADVHPCKIILPPEKETPNGVAVLFSTAENDGSIDVILGLEISQMERLTKDNEFRKYRVQQ